MPTNLPPEYYDIEERHRAATTPQEKITSLEAMLSVIPNTPGMMPIGDIQVQIQDFIKKLKSARIWGSGAFDGHMVARDHVLQDGDVVELKA